LVQLLYFRFYFSRPYLTLKRRSCSPAKTAILCSRVRLQRSCQAVDSEGTCHSQRHWLGLSTQEGSVQELTRLSQVDSNEIADHFKHVVEAVEVRLKPFLFYRNRNNNVNFSVWSFFPNASKGKATSRWASGAKEPCKLFSVTEKILRCEEASEAKVSKCQPPKLY